MSDEHGWWLPEPRPILIMSVGKRFRIRRTARGWAVYDHALGELVGLHRSKNGALRHKSLQQTLLKAVRDSARASA